MSVADTDRAAGNSGEDAAHRIASQARHDRPRSSLPPEPEPGAAAPVATQRPGW